MTHHAAPSFSKRVEDGIDSFCESARAFALVRDLQVLRSLVPSGWRGLVLKQGRSGPSSRVRACHDAAFGWDYRSDQPEMAALYQRAKAGQWDADSMPWHLDVDLENPHTALVPADFLDWDLARTLGIKLDRRERDRLLRDCGAWALSQFLHGEQGALYAAAQVTEAIEHFDGTLYGSTQVMDEARHVETFSRYIETKIGKRYAVQDNLFTILDALMTDARWDIKFLGMQIMVEGLALGAFGLMYRRTQEPLIKEILENVIRDETRHVHYGVVALREHIARLSERERREREDWVFQIAMLMRNRWMAYEVYDEWFGGSLRRDKWRKFILEAPGAAEFRHLMFSRLIPNLREIGLLSPRIQPAYESAGLMRYYRGRAAHKLVEEDVLSGDADSA